MSAYTDGRIAEVVEEHNALVRDITSIEGLDFNALDDEAKLEEFARRDELYQRVDALKAERVKLERQAEADLSPLDVPATPGVMTREGERRARDFDAIARDPLTFWQREVLDPRIERYGDVMAAFTAGPISLPGSARLMFGPARALPGYDEEYRRQSDAGVLPLDFDEPGSPEDAQEPTQGYFGRFGPVYSPAKALSITPQVMAPGANFQFLRGTITTNEANPVSQSGASTQSVYDFAPIQVELTTVGTFAEIEAIALRVPGNYLTIVETLLQGLSQREVSQGIVSGDGTSNAIHGFATPESDALRPLLPAAQLTTTVDMSSAATAGQNLVAGVDTSIDKVEFRGAGMATHALTRYEALAAIRTQRDGGGWALSSQFPTDRGNIRYRGMEFVSTSELPAYASTSMVSIVGDWTMGAYLARLGEVELLVRQKPESGTQVYEVQARIHCQFVAPIPAKFDTVTRTA